MFAVGSTVGSIPILYMFEIWYFGFRLFNTKLMSTKVVSKFQDRAGLHFQTFGQVFAVCGLNYIGNSE